MNPENLFNLYFEEDCPYFDETMELLKINGNGTMKIISRENGVAACTDDLYTYLSSHGLDVEAIPNGEEFSSSSTILKAKGNLKTLFKVWRVSQTFLSITCAIATATKRIVEKAKEVNPNIIIATTRKTHPGMRYFEIKSVRAGGGNVHRNSLSDSILITQNHFNIVGEIEKLQSLKKIEIEPKSLDEVEKYAKIADVLLLDHIKPNELKEIAPRLREINPKLEIAVAGNINEENIVKYAKFADVIVTSSPYYAKPLDLTTKIVKSDF